MITAIAQEIAEDFPDAETLDEQKEAIEKQLLAIEQDIISARESARSLLEMKQSLISSIGADQQRVNDIALALENFEQLKRVYVSDIERLEALEEAGFLLGKDSKKLCPVCGAPPEAQDHSEGVYEIEAVRRAAEFEIAKIRTFQTELLNTVAHTETELQRIADRLLKSQEQLAELERTLKDSSPNAEEQKRQFTEIIPRRDRVNYGLGLLKRQTQLENQKKLIEKSKQSRVRTDIQEGLTTQVTQEFADVVSEVLTAWHFPGERKVFFDHETYDLIIDGKRRKDNGKGVRAITHAAFKVAVLLYCHRKNLPHPGFLVLDTPLVTYRDPITSKAGQLTADEEALKNTDLKVRLFEHLASLGPNFQFIVFDNADPADILNDHIHVETFTNDPSFGRQGLL